MREFWDTDAKFTLKVSLIAAACVYIPIALWSVGKGMYEDHEGLVARSRTQNLALRADAETLQRQKENDALQLSDCQQKNARVGGQNEVLNNQNRAQQNTINNCQTQALKLLTPVAQKTTVVFFSEDDSKTPAEARFLLLTNQPVTPVDMVVQCNASLESVMVGPVGKAMMGGGNQRLGPNVQEATVDSPAWTPTVPFMATISYYRGGSIVCSFNLR